MIFIVPTCEKIHEKKPSISFRSIEFDCQITHPFVDRCQWICLLLSADDAVIFSRYDFHHQFFFRFAKTIYLRLTVQLGKNNMRFGHGHFCLMCFRYKQSIYNFSGIDLFVARTNSLQFIECNRNDRKKYFLQIKWFINSIELDVWCNFLIFIGLTGGFLFVINVPSFLQSHRYSWRRVIAIAFFEPSFS